MSPKDLINNSICKACGKIVPSVHEEINGEMYLVKNCPDCGKSKYLVSSDAKRYIEKRKLCEYEAEAERTCSLNCMNCTHGKIPSLVFIDVTNRCNMNCPICLANIPAMGFRFDPPIEYFEKIFIKLNTMTPKPKIQLFGGEPTVRDDLTDIIKLAQSYGISARVVTNGIRLANEEYCKKLLSTRPQLMFAFDGRDPEIYKKIRKSEKTYELKIKALENIRKYKKSKVTIMCTTGWGVNDHCISDLIDFCHENRDIIAALDFIPIVAHWGPEKVSANSSTIEDVEKIVENARPGTQFFPASILYKFNTLKEVFDARLTFGGAHPNCESVSLMVSDGEKYQPFTKYLKNDVNTAIIQAVKVDEAVGKRIKKSLFVKLFGKRGAQLIYSYEILKLLKQNVKAKEVLGKNPILTLTKILLGVMSGKKLKTMFRKHTKFHSILRMIILPFEEAECVESARLVDCPAAFAYEHPKTKEICFMPVCAWALHKDDILRETAKNYSIAKTSSTNNDMVLAK